MREITIDADLCKKDGLCAMTCMSTVFQQKEKNTIPEILDIERCYGCGQCVALCTQGAITHSDYPEGTIHPIRSEYLPTYDHVLELIRSRRSKRLYKDTKVEREAIEKVLEAARLSPSGHNKQTTEFVVVQDEKILHEIASLTAESLRKFVAQAGNPIARTMMRLMLGRREADARIEVAPDLGGIVTLFDSGTDFIIREAPVLILFCADGVTGFASENANLSLHNAALAAETLGLGCFYAGFVVVACSLNDSIERHLSLPENLKVFGALAMGNSRLKFNKWPERNPAKVTWMGGDD